MLSVHSCPVGQLGTKDTGGMSVYIRETARELGKLGHTVDVYTRVHDPRDPLIESLGENANLIHLRVGGEEAIHKLVLFSYLPDFSCALEAHRKELGLTYDVIFSNYWLSAEVGQEVKNWWRVPNLTMFHTIGIIKNSLDVGEDEPELRIQREKTLARESDRVVAATEGEKEILVEAIGARRNRVGVVPCGVNLTRFHPVPQPEARALLGFSNEKLVLFAGRMEPLKGIDLLLHAFAGLPSRNGTKLVIIGGDDEGSPEAERLMQLSEDLKLGDSIVFRGTVEHDFMPYYYAAADVCVVPSYYESFGLVALESLACGTPVVSTDVGDLKNIIREGRSGFVVSDHSAEALSLKMAEVLSWPERTARQAEAVRSSVLRHSWADVAKQLERQFQLALRQNVTVLR